MDASAVLRVLVENGPANKEAILLCLMQKGPEVVIDEVDRALAELQRRGAVAVTPRGKWRLDGVVVDSVAQSGETGSGRRTRSFIYSPDILRDCPKLERNTFLHFVSDEFGGFRLRDYVDGRRIEVSKVAGITKGKELQERYSWTEVEFDEDEVETPLTVNEFWEARLTRLNESHSSLLSTYADKCAV